MHRIACAVLTLPLFSGWHALAAGDEDVDAAPDWIWVDDDYAGQNVRLTKTFTLDSAPVQAELRIAADFCDVVVEINSTPVLELEDFSPTQTLDMTRQLAPGENQIAVVARPGGGPTAVALSIHATGADGDTVRLLTDDSWTANAGAVNSLGRVASQMWGIGARPARISPLDDYEQWKRALGDDSGSDSGRFWTVDGFEIELVKAAAANEGSWVALTFDESGRLTIAREDRGLLRFTFDEPGGDVANVETIDDELLECRGLVYVDGDLYANANNSKSLYQLRDADRGGRFDESTVVREFPGTVGHGRNQLAVHDGALWTICGDAVDVPTDMFDRTSPYREARRGELTREGFLARMDLGTGEWQLYCAGMRNPFGVAFNRDDEAFAYDADAEYDMGSPWYRPTRVLHLRSGADYGWRGVTKSWPPYDPDHPDNAQPLLDIGKGSPTAVAFGYDSNFPPVYRDALYILDWAYGRVLAVHLTPRGGTYRAQAETFLQGSPLNVTGIDFGPDGAMYLVTGGRNTKSAMYRVRFTGDPSAEPIRAAHEAALAQQAAEMRQVRRHLELGHNRVDRLFVSEALQHLDSRDPSLRYAAQTALEHQPGESWHHPMLNSEPSGPLLVALLAMARNGAPEAARPVLEQLLEFDFVERSVSEQLVWLYAVSLCRKADSELDAEFRESLLEQLDARFPDTSDVLRVSGYGTSVDANRELARLLVALEAPGIVERCVAELRRSTAQEDRLHYLFLLRDVESGWTDETRRAYFTALGEADGFVAGEGMPTFLQLIREAALERLSDAERTELASLLAPAGGEEPAERIERPLVREWTFDDLREALDRSGHEASAERGADVFQQALCVRCHRVGARGPAVGPDLTYVGRRFSRDDILQSIVLPNRVVAENYRNLEVVTTDGRVITGRPITAGDYRSPRVSIAVDPLRPAEIVVLSKQDIEVSRLSATSPMPAGLLNTFTVDEISDLLAYLTRIPGTKSQ